MKSNVLAVSVEKAQKIMSEWVRPVQGTEVIPIREALFRVLAEEVTSPVDVPSSDNAAMDGYAFSAIGLDLTVERTLKMVGTVYAGQLFESPLSPGECVKVMTGVLMPAGSDTVVQHENVTEKDGHVTIIPNGASPGINVRRQGEDVKAGSTVLTEGVLLKPAHLGLLASVGLDTVRVRRRLKVAVFSTGDELSSVGEALVPGHLYDSNRYSLDAMLRRIGCEIMDMGIVRDNPLAIRAAFSKAAKEADAIITTGGISVGEADYTKAVLAELGEMAFWNINMRPGRPFAFGRIVPDSKEVAVFGLPGNPVAVMLSFYFLVRNALFHMMGTRPPLLFRMRVKTLSPLSKRLGRTEFQRGILAPDEHGNWVVRTTGDQGSAILSSMVHANCIIILPAEGVAVSPGETVEVVPLDGLI